MHRKIVFLFISATILCTACSVNIADESNFTATPEFVTAVLPSTLISPSPIEQFLTQTSTPPSAIPTLPPVEGTTTTQINVRAEPSTGSRSLGMIDPFVKVQVIGRDASGSWYQIIYTESATDHAWVRAEYVRVNTPAEIPLVETQAGSRSALSGLVIQKINVRNGPGIENESLGVLNSNDVVFITGKDSSGAWMQIEFTGASNGKGWVALEFLQVTNTEAVPLIRNTVNETSTPASTTLPRIIMSPAIQDGDSMQAPLTTTIFSPSGTHTLQVQGDVSAPNGDTEDWIQFSANNGSAAVQVMCSSNTLRLELWNNGKIVDDFSLTCGNERLITIASNSIYSLHLFESNTGELRYTSYLLTIEIIR